MSRLFSVLVIVCVLLLGALPSSASPGDGATLDAQMSTDSCALAALVCLTDASDSIAQRTRMAAQAACPTDIEFAAECGAVAVPLERDDPAGPMIDIHYELYRHSGEGPARSVIVPMFRDPGQPNTVLREMAFGLFRSQLGQADLLLIDQRGTGRSSRIACPELEGAPLRYRPWTDAASDCAASLGSNADDYSTGDMAQDTHDIVTELGYDEVDLYGLTYGGLHVIAFATRFPEMVRSALVDSPFTPDATDPFELASARAQSAVGAVTRYCESSRSCDLAFERPGRVIERLIRSVRRDPITERAYAGNELRRVALDEELLFGLTTIPNTILTYGDLTAAAAALENDDPAPILRLGAETEWGSQYLYRGDPAYFSVGTSTATHCADARVPWEWGTDEGQRLQAFERARSGLPKGWSAPFSPKATTPFVDDVFGKACVGWEIPSQPTPLVPEGGSLADAPVMVLAGEFDAKVPRSTSEDTLGFFDEGTVYEVPSFEVTFNWQVDCTLKAMVSFMQTLDLPDAVCDRPNNRLPAQPSFPSDASDVPLRGVRISPNDASGPRQHRVAVAVARTFEDALMRGPIGFRDGRCLRSGSYATSAQDSRVVRLNGCEFIDGVKVSGRGDWNSILHGGGGNAWARRLEVSGPGGMQGYLRIDGIFGGTVFQQWLWVDGKLGGKPVHISIPSS